jgi:hypothetical protein
VWKAAEVSQELRVDLDPELYGGSRSNSTFGNYSPAGVLKECERERGAEGARLKYSGHHL